MARVDACPENLTTIIKASKRLGCDKDLYGNDKYICLPTVDRSSLVEFCYNGIMGYYEKGTFMLCLTFYCIKHFFRTNATYIIELFTLFRKLFASF